MRKLVIGDYVLATKYTDGDPMDHFCVGFFSGMLVDRTGIPTERYLVANGRGVTLRASGFRRCERIQKKTGKILVDAFPFIGDRPGRSIWYWRRHIKELQEFVKSVKSD